MDGRFAFVRYDVDGDARLGPAAYAMLVAAAGLLVLVAMLVRAVLNGEQ